jgi:hypothetical protein
MADTPSFLESLRDFAAGVTPLEVFNTWLVGVLLRGPSISEDDRGELQAHFPIEVDAAMYLDMVCDTKDPDFDELEARRLAGALCAIVTQVEDPEDQAVLAHLARWSNRSAEGIRQHLSGVLDREAFERFLARRPWPDALRTAVIGLDNAQLHKLAAGLEVNDFAAVEDAFDRQGEPW